MPSMIAIFGAGSIGCWVGGRLAAGGAEVTLIGRTRVMDEVRSGVVVSEPDRPAQTVRVRATTEPGTAALAAITLVTVKSAQTAEAGAILANVLPAGATVVSLQNGVRNADVLRRAMPAQRVFAGMVPFNVVRRGPGAYHRASAGKLMIDEDPAAAPLLEACAAARLPIESRRDMPAVQWAKLVMNLNNAINALSGKPLASELGLRSYRKCLSAAQREALDLLAESRTKIAQITIVPPAWMPRVLLLPDSLFRIAARRAVAIDPLARSSMSDDLDAGRTTEVDYLQGEVIALADRIGRTAPVSRAIVRLVRAAEAGGRRDWAGDELFAAITR